MTDTTDAAQELALRIVRELGFGAGGDSEEAVAAMRIDDMIAAALAEKEREVERLRKENDWLNTFTPKIIAKGEAAESKLAKLRRYTCHMRNCDIELIRRGAKLQMFAVRTDCTCGLEAALNEEQECD